MREPYQSSLPCLEEAVRQRLADSPRCHDWDHTSRVVVTARKLARLESADEAVVTYAALLHDIGRAAEESNPAESCHAELGAQGVPGILRDSGVEDATFIAHVSECVRTHRYRKRDEKHPETLEARIVFDADKLDSIGAIGIGRAFHFAGRVGARVHNTRREALESDEYSEEDTAYREFLVKLQHLSEAMLTEAGRQLAVERHRFMVTFFNRLNEEVGEHSLLPTPSPPVEFLPGCQPPCI